MGDVLEYLIDGTSGLAPGGVEGSAIIAGVCSRGQVGKGYIIGKSSDLFAMLGVGPLVSRVQDVLSTAGQNPIIIAVPVTGEAGGYISEPHIVGQSPLCAISGYPQRNADIVMKVITEGQIGTATIALSLDDGKTFSNPVVSSAQIVFGADADATGATLVFDDDTDILRQNTSYIITVRTAIGLVEQVGEESPQITIKGEVLAAAQLVIEIVKPGNLNQGTYRLSVDGGDNFLKTRTIPIDGVYSLIDYGVSISFPDGEYKGGVTYLCELLPPVPSITNVMEALETPLSLYDVEFVLVAGASDSVDWAAAQAKTEELWNAHRPTYFKMESRLPYAGEDLNDFTAYLLAEKQNFAGRFVQVCAQFGEVRGTDGYSHFRNMAALQAGRTISIPVQRATGRVKDGPISQAGLISGWDAVQPVLENAGFLTAKKYAGLSGIYWGDSRTMADDTSDYRYEEVVRVSFKAVRKMRIAALKSMYDEAGDPLYPDNVGGLAYLKASIENALDTLVKAIPTEMAGYVVTIPLGQDIVNNGVAVEITLIGIPIIRQIKLFASYTYAGSNFDPRLA